MLRNYFRSVWRSLLKDRWTTIINISGLALGLTSFLLIALYVVDELSYDRYNTKAERIYRVNSDLKYGDVTTSFAIAAPPLAAALRDHFPEVENAVRITPAGNIRFKRNDETILEDKAAYGDAGIFDVFTLPFLYGDPATALKEPNSVVISESTARKYFGRADVIGSTLISSPDNTPKKITGVMKDMPAQSHFNYDLFLTLPNSGANSFTGFKYTTYILLKRGTDAHRLESKFPGFLKQVMNTPDFDFNQFVKDGNFIRINLTPLRDIHLKSNRQRELGTNGDIKYVYIFSIIAVFILLLACINFINLATARSANRAREVGIRKVLGSPRALLITRFLAESTFLAFFSAFTAFLASWLLLPAFNNLAGKEITLLSAAHWFVPLTIVVTLLVGLLAGVYPAFFLSSFQPASVLKGKLSSGFKGGILRNLLVTFQFSISIFLIVGTIVVYNQLNFIQNKDIGFNRHQVLIIRNANAIKDPTVFKNVVEKLPGVSAASLSAYLPTGTFRGQVTMDASGAKTGGQTEKWLVDPDYIKTMGMQMLRGRNFSAEMLSDSSAAVINEAAAKQFGYNGKSVLTIHDNKAYTVIGVVRDFNFSSLRDKITPVVMVLGKTWRSSLNVRAEADNLPALLRQIGTQWRSMVPGQHFDYSFMDDDFDALYRSEQRMGKIAVLFTGLALFIACLGLFSLAAYAAEQRGKELSIRKILGATPSAIFTLLTKDFIRLIVIAVLISSPAAWWAMNKWLEGFSYRIDISLWIFFSCGALVLLIAVLTVAYQAVKAAVANPVTNLRLE